jgi:hypothetical protein
MPCHSTVWGNKCAFEPPCIFRNFQGSINQPHRNLIVIKQNHWICDILKPNLAPTGFGQGGLMTARARLIPVIAVLLLVVLGDGYSNVGFARATENCLAAPNGQAPNGSRWQYRTDPVKQTKCWYLRAEGEAIQKPAVQEKPEPVTAKWPGAATVHDQAAAPAATGGSLMRGSIQGGSQTSRQAGADKVALPDPPGSVGADKVAWPDPPASAGASEVAWPDPPASASASKVAWPDPPTRGRSATQGTNSQNTTEDRGNLTQVVPTTTASHDKDAGNADGAEQAAAQIQTAVSQSGMSVGVLLAIAIGLLIAGTTVRQIVRKFARQHSDYPKRREPFRTTSVASEHTKPTFVVRDDDRLDNEVKEELRKLLRGLDSAGGVRFADVSQNRI